MSQLAAMTPHGPNVRQVDLLVFNADRLAVCCVRRIRVCSSPRRSSLDGRQIHRDGQRQTQNNRRGLRETMEGRIQYVRTALAFALLSPHVRSAGRYHVSNLSGGGSQLSVATQPWRHLLENDPLGGQTLLLIFDRYNRDH